MKYLQNLVFRGGKSIGLLLLLFLLLGNGGVWAQDLNSLSFGTPLVDEDFSSLSDYSSSTKGTVTNYEKNGVFNYMYCNKGAASYGIESTVFGSQALFLTPDGTSPLVVAITNKTFGECGAFSFKVTKSSKCHVGLYAKINNTLYAKVDASVYLHCSAGNLSIGNGSSWVSITTAASDIIDVCVIYNNTTDSKTYGDGIVLGAKTAHIFVNGECIKNGEKAKDFTIPGASLTAFRVAAAESTKANIDDVKIYGALPTTSGPKEKRAITIETPTNGTLKVLNGETEVNSGDAIEEGTILTVEAKANTGYKLSNWQAVENGSEQTFTDVFTYTVGKNDVTFKANFDEIVYHTITWSVNGVKKTEQVEGGTAITFVTPTENIPEGYVFKGWYSSTLEPQDNAPTYVTSATADADITYYAVFAKSNGGGTEEATLIANHTTASSYGERSYEDNKNNTWNGNVTEQTNPVRFGLKSTGGSYLESPEFPGIITDIEITTYNTAGSDRYFYIDSQKTSQNGDLGKVTAPKGDTSLKAQKAVLTGSFNKFCVNVSGALGFGYIKVTYSSEVFTDFRTSVTAPTTPAITLAEVCTDGTKYYGTYSNSKAFIVPKDLEVAKISVDNGGKLIVTTYGEGTIVPANTGVMVSSNTSGKYEVTLSNEDGESELSTGNMLRPTGDEGIAAAGMTANDANCKYYRLTMHKGTTLGFFYGAADGAAFNVAANKAYLAVPVETAAKVSSFVIGGGSTTAIDGIEAGNGANANRKVYNLQGQRVSGTLPKGLYIIDGRKVIVK